MFILFSLARVFKKLTMLFMSGLLPGIQCSGKQTIAESFCLASFTISEIRSLTICIFNEQLSCRAAILTKLPVTYLLLRIDKASSSIILAIILFLTLGS